MRSARVNPPTDFHSPPPIATPGLNPGPSFATSLRPRESPRVRFRFRSMNALLRIASLLSLSAALALAASAAPAGFAPLFNGKDLSGWKVPEGDNGHWKVLNGVIDYDARSEA